MLSHDNLPFFVFTFLMLIIVSSLLSFYQPTLTFFIDFVIEFEKDVTKEMYGEFISNSFYETNNKEFLMDYVNTDNNHPYIKIETKNSEHNLRGLYEYCCIFTFTHCMQFF